LDAQGTGEHLEALRGDGDLTPEAVLKDATKKRSPLHIAFEWDDSAAAHQHRLNQARYMLRSIVVVLDDAPEAEPIRAFVNVAATSEHRYTHIQIALSDETMREQLIAKARSEMEGWRRRYTQLHELSAVFAAIDGLFKIGGEAEPVAPKAKRGGSAFASPG
jgi:hypothetical protein